MPPLNRATGFYAIILSPSLSLSLVHLVPPDKFAFVDKASVAFLRYGIIVRSDDIRAIDTRGNTRATIQMRLSVSMACATFDVTQAGKPVGANRHQQVDIGN